MTDLTHSEAKRLAAFCKDVCTATRNRVDRGGDFASENERHSVAMLRAALNGYTGEPLGIKLTERQRKRARV